MAKILVLYCSSCGHVERMAEAIARPADGGRVIASLKNGVTCHKREEPDRMLDFMREVHR